MRIIIRDRNKHFLNEFLPWVDKVPDLELQHGDIFLDENFDAIVSPANSFGFMNGGVDYAYVQKYGQQLEDRARSTIQQCYAFGELLVGQATAIPLMPHDTAKEKKKWLIIAPTMRVPKPINDAADVYLAARAAINVAFVNHYQTVVMPGMGTGVGQVPFDRAARNMVMGIVHGLHTPHPFESCGEAFLDHCKFSF